MGFFGFVGRALFVSVFILSGVNQLVGPATSPTGRLPERYKVFYNKYLTQYDASIPAQLKPTFISAHAAQIVQFDAIFEVVIGALILLGARKLSLLLTVHLLITLLIVHNPFLHNDPKNLGQEIQNFLVQLALLGGSLIVASSDRSSDSGKGKKAEVKKSSVKQTETKSSSQPKKKRE